MRRALVYAGSGSDVGCVRALVAQLRLLAAPWRLKVDTIGVDQLRALAWQSSTALLCLPGGRDLPYLRLLGGATTRAIRQWVNAGGRYFGSCAGAYFAAERIAFAAARVPSVHGVRPLRFFRGLAWGPSQAADEFAYGGTSGRRALRVRDATEATGITESTETTLVFNRGGCAFAPLPGRRWPRNARVLARAPVLRGQGRATDAFVALYTQVGRGAALLWGAHPELAWPTRRTGAHAAPAHADSARLLRRHLWRLLRAG